MRFRHRHARFTHDLRQVGRQVSQYRERPLFAERRGSHGRFRPPTPHANHPVSRERHSGGPTQAPNCFVHDAARFTLPLDTKKPALGGSLLTVGMNQTFFLRLDNPNPNSPIPRSARVLGSGTLVIIVVPPRTIWRFTPE